MDPLCEQTPWQSPYAYAGNNFINCIDHMGLMSVRQCVVTNIEGRVINVVDDGDNSIYICLDDEWDPQFGKGDLIRAGEMEHSYLWYLKRYIEGGGGGGRASSFKALSKGQIATAIGRSLSKDISLGIADNLLREEIGKKMGSIGFLTTTIIGDTRTIQNAYNIYEYYLEKGYNPRFADDFAKEALTLAVTSVLDGTAKKMLTTLGPKVAPVALSVAPYALATAGVVLSGWCYYKAGEYFINTVNSLESTLNGKGFWANYGGYGYDGSEW